MALSSGEITAVLLMAVIWAAPLVAGIWALVTLHRIRAAQDDIRNRLAAIERAVQPAGSPRG